MRISDIIENFIKDLLENDKQAIIQRNDLAEQFNCVPSQINYVISTRFTPIQGYYVESQRGGGGYIKIKKVNLTQSDYLMHIITSIGNNISAKEVDVFVNNFLDYGVIDEKIAKLLKGATNDKVLGSSKIFKFMSILLNIFALNSSLKNEKDELRAKIFKSMLINLV